MRVPLCLCHLAQGMQANSLFSLLMQCTSQHLADMALTSIPQLLSEGYQHLYEKLTPVTALLGVGILSHHMLSGEF